MIKRLASVLVLSAGFIIFCRHPVQAASPQGVTVSPAFQQVSILPGEKAHQVTFSITNHEPVAQTFKMSAADFNTLSESGGLFFVGTNPTALQKKYGLAKWFSLPQNSVTLQPGQTTTINAQILNLPDMSPGGHYGALMLAAGGGAAASPGVSLQPIASSLMFVTKVGGDIHALDLISATTNRNLLKLPDNVTLKFHATGNTHVIPRGVIKLLTAGGKLVGQGIINQDSDIILPGNYRQIEVPLTKFAGGRPLGDYQLKADYRFDGITNFREYKQSFWYLDPRLIIGLIIAAASLVLLLIKRRTSRP